MREKNLRLKCLPCLTEVQLGTYSDSSHDLLPCEVVSLLLVPYQGGGSLRLKCLACLSKVQVGMYSDSSHGLVPWEVFSKLLVSWDTRKFKTEVSGTPDRSATRHVF